MPPLSPLLGSNTACMSIGVTLSTSGCAEIESAIAASM